jgi:hypothetical protein
MQICRCSESGLDQWRRESGSITCEEGGEGPGDGDGDGDLLLLLLLLLLLRLKSNMLRALAS